MYGCLKCEKLIVSIGFSSGSEEYLMNRKTKLKYKKKKKKKLLFKILLGALIFIVAKVALHKLSYLFPTVSAEI